jgi:hypothetical protein
MQTTQSVTSEFLRLGLIYMHLIACCVAVGSVLLSDIAMVRQLFKGDEVDAASHAESNKHMGTLKQIVSVALMGLWASGVAIVALDAYNKGWLYFENPKLQAKVLIVVLLTINGTVLHHRVLPWMKQAGSLLNLTFQRAVFAIFAGTVSGVSWFYAAMLGVGRSLSWKYSLFELMMFYPLLIAGGFFSMLLLIVWCKYRTNKDRQDFLPTQVHARG